MKRFVPDLSLNPLLLVVVAGVLGMVVGSFYPNDKIWLGGFFLFLLFAFVTRFWINGRIICIYLSVFFLSAFWLVKAERETWIELSEHPIQYEAVVMTEPIEKGKVIRCDLVVLNGEHPLQVKATILRDTVDFRYQRLHVGDGIRAVSKLKQPKNYYPSSTFDYALWLRHHGYVAQTFIGYDEWQKAVIPLASLSYLQHLQLYGRKVRSKALAHFHHLSSDGDAISVVAAMALGEKSKVSKELREDYSKSGASHLLALSGLHLGIIYTLLSLLFLRRRHSLLVQVLLITSLWCYALLVGLPSSVVRSALMISLYAFVGIISRRPQPLNSLSFAAIVMLIANPLTLYDIGFQLSFLAVLSIVLFMPLLEAFFPFVVHSRRWILRWFGSIMLVSVAAQFGTAPLVAYYFGRFSTYFLLTNLFAIPCTIIILHLVVLFLFSTPMPTVQIFIGRVVETVATYLNRYINWIASLPGSSIEGLAPSAWRVVAIYLLIFAVYYFLVWLKSRKKVPADYV